MRLVTSIPSIIFSKDKPHAELQFIAVLPEQQNKGLGKEMMGIMGSELVARGINQYYVGTKKDNILSNNFYQKHGFVFSHTKRYFGDTLNYYISPDVSSR